MYITQKVVEKIAMFWSDVKTDCVPQCCRKIITPAGVKRKEGRDVSDMTSLLRRNSWLFYLFFFSCATVIEATWGSEHNDLPTGTCANIRHLRLFKISAPGIIRSLKVFPVTGKLLSPESRGRIRTQRPRPLVRWVWTARTHPVTVSTKWVNRLSLALFECISAYQRALI